MSDTYVECLVKAKQSILSKFFMVFLIVLTVLFVIAMPVIPPAMLIALITGAGAYFVNLYSNLEYEYLYLDKEIVIDKIMAKTKRKRVAAYDVGRIEILAPVHSHQLDSYRGRNVKTMDYSIGQELKPDLRYAMYYEGNVRVILSPSEEMIKVLKSVAPRKVFTD